MEALAEIKSRSRLLAKSFSPSSLMGRIEEVYQQFFGDSYTLSAQEIISSDENSAEFIRWLLIDEDFREAIPGNPIYEFSKGRARHSVLTFLVGMIFIDSFGFVESIQKVFEYSGDRDKAIRLWMLTALYHDRAYYSTYLSKPDLDYRRIVSYYLLDDIYKPDTNPLAVINGFTGKRPAAMAYTYDEIEAYDSYARSIHPFNNNDKELVDHGILGGVTVFDMLAKKLIKKRSKLQEHDFLDELLDIKTSSITIAQHNIFKSEKKEYDLKYGPELAKLHHNSPFVINMSTPLLLLLSLVDTFECIKRFSKSENERSYLQMETVLEKIAVKVGSGSITANFNELVSHIENNKDKTLFNNCYKKYWSSLCGIGSWTAFSAEKQDGFSVKFTLRGGKSK